VVDGDGVTVPLAVGGSVDEADSVDVLVNVGCADAFDDELPLTETAALGDIEESTLWRALKLDEAHCKCVAVAPRDMVSYAVAVNDKSAVPVIVGGPEGDSTADVESATVRDDAADFVRGGDILAITDFDAVDDTLTDAVRSEVEDGLNDEEALRAALALAVGLRDKVAVRSPVFDLPEENDAEFERESASEPRAEAVDVDSGERDALLERRAVPVESTETVPGIDAEPLEDDCGDKEKDALVEPLSVASRETVFTLDGDAFEALAEAVLTDVGLCEREPGDDGVSCALSEANDVAQGVAEGSAETVNDGERSELGLPDDVGESLPATELDALGERVAGGDAVANDESDADCDSSALLEEVFESMASRVTVDSGVLEEEKVAEGDRIDEVEKVAERLSTSAVDVPTADEVGSSELEREAPPDIVLSVPVG
jgi:hypothetical protein